MPSGIASSCPRHHSNNHEYLDQILDISQHIYGDINKFCLLLIIKRDFIIVWNSLHLRREAHFIGVRDPMPF